MVLAVTFCVCLITANLMEIKVIEIGPLTITAGVIIFPVSYIISDCIVEIYGLKRAKMVIWLGFAMNLFVSLMLQLGVLLPGAPSWEGQEAMELIFGAVPRIFIASFIAFLAGTMTNAYIMNFMRLRAVERERHSAMSFSFRAITSTIFGEGIDSAVFFPIAFGGVLPWSVVIELIITQTILKTLYEIVILPVTLLTVKKLRRLEDKFSDS